MKIKKIKKPKRRRFAHLTETLNRWLTKYRIDND